MMGMTEKTEIAVGDIGGTHARYAMAEIAGGRVVRLGEPVTFRTRDFASLAMSWEAFGRGLGRDLPRAAALAVACPVSGEVLQLTNNPWVIRPATLAQELGVEALTLVNDFGAVGHAVGALGPEHLMHLAGPDSGLPAEGVVSVIGPGTGFGVAHVLRVAGKSFVIECEGGHMDFSPLDTLEDAILAKLRQRYTRVSVERVVSGPGLKNIYEALGEIEDREVQLLEDTALWGLAIEGKDALAAVALQRFCLGAGRGRCGDCRRDRAADCAFAAKIWVWRAVCRQGAVRAVHVGHSRKTHYSSATRFVGGCRGFCRQQVAIRRLFVLNGPDFVRRR
jgi:glucokinase